MGKILSHCQQERKGIVRTSNSKEFEILMKLNRQQREARKTQQILIKQRWEEREHLISCLRNMPRPANRREKECFSHRGTNFYTYEIDISHPIRDIDHELILSELIFEIKIYPETTSYVRYILSYTGINIAYSGLRTIINPSCA